MPLTGVDLATYVRVGRYPLPEPLLTAAPPNSKLAQEVSAVTYNWDTDTLFVVGDGGTSIVQVSKTGALINSMTLAPGSSPQGTDFYDPEGLAYVGGGQFVMAEERDRIVHRFTYVANSTLARSGAQSVQIGTSIGNIGIEGITNDPATAGYVAVKESTPLGLFQTGIDFGAGTATNGSPTTVNSVDLFTPNLVGTLDFADIFSLSNVSTLTGPDAANLLVLSQESGQVVEVDRSGTVASVLTIAAAPTDTISVPDMQHEGMTMDNDGNLYLVAENGGGDINHPEMWVYSPSALPNQAPTALTLANQITSITENTNTAVRIKVADVLVTDDGLGTNLLSVSGADAASFEVDVTGLYITAGVILDFETKASYSVTVGVDDASLGGNPDASAPFTITVTDLVNETPTLPSIIVSEVTPWASGNAPYAADWFEITNTGTTTVSLAGWRVDDNSNSFASGLALTGVPSIAPGTSVIFIEGNAATATAFQTAWFGTNVPVGFTIGTYSGGGIGLSTGGDAVNIFDGSGNRVTGVAFGTSTTGFTFDNAAGAGSSTLPLPIISTLSVAGTNKAFLAVDGVETGSPGLFPSKLVITEVSSYSSSGTPYLADWFEVTNTGLIPVDVTGWSMDDNSNTAGIAPLTGVSVIAPGQSAVFAESSTTIPGFTAAWFSGGVPSGFLMGLYTGAGIGLSSGGDSVNVFDAAGNRVTGVSFGAATPGVTFDNTIGVGSSTLPLPAIGNLSVVGVNGAFVAADGIETGSPGRTSGLGGPEVPEFPLPAVFALGGLTILALAATRRRTLA